MNKETIVLRPMPLSEQNQQPENIPVGLLLAAVIVLGIGGAALVAFFSMMLEG